MISYIIFTILALARQIPSNRKSLFWFSPVGGGSSAGVLAGAWAPGGMWMLLKLVVGGPDAPDPGLGVKPIPGAGPGPKPWSWSYGGPPLTEPLRERSWPEKPTAPNSSTRQTEGQKQKTAMRLWYCRLFRVSTVRGLKKTVQNI